MAQTVETAETGETPPEPRAPWPRRSRRERAPRQARVVLRKVGPWSVLKVSLLFYFCVMLAILGGFIILYAIMAAAGVLDQVANLINEFGFGDKDFEINGGWILGRLVVGGAVMVVVWSLINLFVAFLYNLISDVVGGIEVTLGDER